MRSFFAVAVMLLLPWAAQAEPYDRALYKHWVDANRDCQDTRVEVLIIESLVAVTLSADRCKVVRGKWFDAYTGRTFTDPRKLDIDHLVALGEAHRSGADHWSAARRQKYANDLSNADTLIAVSLGANRSKGDKDPARWLPKNAGYRCAYVKKWVAVKARWGLSMDAAERTKITAIRAAC